MTFHQIIKKFFLRLLVPLCLFSTVGCIRPYYTSLVLHNKTKEPIEVEVIDPKTSAPSYHTIPSGSMEGVVLQAMYGALSCKADMGNYIVTIKYSNGVSIPYDRHELLKVAKWDPNRCDWKMDVSLRPIKELELAPIREPQLPVREPQFKDHQLR